MLSAHQLADALQVAVASAKEEHLLDDVILVGCHVDHLGTRARRFVHDVFRLHILSELMAGEILLFRLKDIVGFVVCRRLDRQQIEH